MNPIATLTGKTKNTETWHQSFSLSYVVVASILRFGVTLRQIDFQLGVHYVIPPLQHHFLR